MLIDQNKKISKLLEYRCFHLPNVFCALLKNQKIFLPLVHTGLCKCHFLETFPIPVPLLFITRTFCCVVALRCTSFVMFRSIFLFWKNQTILVSAFMFYVSVLYNKLFYAYVVCITHACVIFAIFLKRLL